MRKFIPETLLGKISLLLIILGISLPFFNNSIFPDDVKRCGKVIDKMVVPKYKSSAELVFLVNFENESVDVEVSRLTYMKYHVGDNVCFMMMPETSSIANLMRVYVVLAWIGFLSCVVYYLSEIF